MLFVLMITSKKIKMTQSRSLRIVTGAIKITPTPPMTTLRENLSPKPGYNNY